MQNKEAQNIPVEKAFWEKPFNTWRALNGGTIVLHTFPLMAGGEASSQSTSCLPQLSTAEGPSPAV